MGGDCPARNKTMAVNLPYTEEDIRRMLACQVHLGTKNVDFQMSRYVFKRKTDGIHIIDLSKTWEKMMLAARIIVAIENPADVCVISARPYGQRAVLKYAQYTGAQYIAGRFTPGCFTNQIQKKFMEPRLLILTDPHTDHQPIREASYVNIPIIAFCDTDSPLRFVDVEIPANNKARFSIGLLYWMLAREVLRLRATISRQSWDVVVDLFFYRELEEAQAAAEASEAPASQYAAPPSDGYAPVQPAPVPEAPAQQWAPPPDITPGNPAEQQWEAPAATEWGAEAPAQVAGWQQ